ncbi:MAG: mechanosensitive ion channel domain-containing protein [Pseudomonadota bacterium]
MNVTTSQRHRLLVALAFLALLFLCITPSYAQVDTEFDPQLLLERIDSITAEVEDNSTAQADLVRYIDQLDQMAGEAQQCQLTVEPEVTNLRGQLALLDDLGPDTDPALFDQRVELSNRLNIAQARELACRQIVDAATALSSDITGVLEELTAATLWRRGPALPTLVTLADEEIAQWPQRIRGEMQPRLLHGLSVTHLLAILIIVGALAIGAGLYARFRYSEWYRRKGYEIKTPPLQVLLPKPFVTHAPLILLGAGLIAVLMICTLNASLTQPVVRVSAAILFYGFACVLIDWMSGPRSPAAQIAGFYPEHVNPVRLRLRIFACAVITSFVLLGADWLTLSVSPTDDPVLLALTILLLSASLWFLIAYLGRIRGLARFRLLRMLVLGFIAVAVFSLFIGFENFAIYLTNGIVKTVFAAATIWLLLWLVFLFFETLADGTGPTSEKLRTALGGDDESRTGVGLIQFAADLILWTSFIVYLIYVWDSSGLYFGELRSSLSDGFQIGDIEIKPASIIFGLAAFAFLIAATGWIKRLLESRWLRHMNLDRGARDAMATLTGYIGFVVAIVVALRIGGIDLGGLALVGGGLALGIGFGLQAIASNFVSGLILLFERPIKAGDFVTVGDTEGFVRRIRIRATDIETLDNQNVLVPNSELVSGRVTNWVLRNPQGRLRIKVGVAYGSDTELVRKLLEQVGRDHEDVISDGGAPAPRALFMGFGDSSLDFELRVRIRRIEKRFTVQSDINFQINEVFREHDIQIPFPQRDLNLVSLPESTQNSVIPEATITTRPIPVDDPRIDDITRSLHYSITATATIERAWVCLTDGDELARWYGSDIDIAARIGGQFSATLPDDTTMESRIDVFMPPRQIRFAEGSPDGEGPLPTGPIFEEMKLRQERKKVTITIDIFGIPASEDWEGYFRRKESHWETRIAELEKRLRDKKA